MAVYVTRCSCGQGSVGWWKEKSWVCHEKLHHCCSPSAGVVQPQPRQVGEDTLVWTVRSSWVLCCAQTALLALLLGPRGDGCTSTVCPSALTVFPKRASEQRAALALRPPRSAGRERGPSLRLNTSPLCSRRKSHFQQWLNHSPGFHWSNKMLCLNKMRFHLLP